MGGLATNHAVMLGLVGRGTVIFSAEPHPDEPSASMATIDGGIMRFWLDGQEYEYVSAEPVGPAGLTSLWMYVVDRDVPDPSRRHPRARPIWVGASDSVDGALAMLRSRPARTSGIRHEA